MAVFPESWSGPRVVLSHDWLTGMRGGERCLEILCEGFPRAPLFTLLYNRAAVSDAINRHPVTPSFLQGIPGIFKHYRHLLPLFPAAIASMRAPPADLLISTSHCAAKALKRPDSARHLCYCFTPMRYAWTFHDEYLGRAWKRAAAAPVLGWLRSWDRKTAANVDRFVAISEHVRRRIQTFYDRDADVVYPPVNTGFYTPMDAAATQAPRSFDLIVSALVPYKRIDLAVQAYTRNNHPLKIVGTGTEFDTLRFLAGDSVEFLGWQSDEAVRDLYRRCRLLVFPGEEDFGIVPLEAQACGRPVVALGRGGALETVTGETGVFFDQQTDAALWEAVETAAARAWDPAAIRRNAERFSIARFIAGLDASIQRCLS
jgi:glycosyltransferase involved in cell wall biosynthesis